METLNFTRREVFFRTYTEEHSHINHVTGDEIISVITVWKQHETKTLFSKEEFIF